MPNHLSPLRALLGFQGNHCASPKVFGAKGDGVTDDLVAIQNTINHLKTLKGGGTLVIDGIYRITNQLEMDTRVSIEGTGSGIVGGSSSAIMLDHATSSVFAWNAAVSGFGYMRQRVRNVFVGAKQANTGSVFGNAASSPLDLLLENVTVNESPGFGLLSGNVWSSGVSSRLTFKNCWLSTVGTSSFAAGNADDELTFDNCRFQTPSGASAHVLSMAAGRLRVTGSDFFGGASPTGSAGFIHTGAAAITRAYGNTFRSSNGDVWPAFTWASGARLVGRDNTIEGGARFTPTGSTPAVLANGSNLQRVNNQRLTLSTPINTTINDDWEQVTITQVNAGTPVWTLPNPLFAGQRLRINFQNSSGGSVTPTFSPSVNTIGQTIGAVPNNGYATYEFFVSDMVTPDTYAWYVSVATHT